MNKELWTIPNSKFNPAVAEHNSTFEILSWEKFSVLFSYI